MGGHSGGGGRAGRGGGGSFNPVNDPYYDLDNPVLSKEDINVINKYVGSYTTGSATADIINPYLANGKIPDGYTKSQMDNMIHDIDSILGKNRLSADAVLYRGVSPEIAKGFGSIGNTYTHKPFMSTASNYADGYKFASVDSLGKKHIMEIKAKKGTKGMTLRGAGTVWGPGESEILMNRGIKLKYIGTREKPKWGSLPGAKIHQFEITK